MFCVLLLVLHWLTVPIYCSLAGDQAGAAKALAQATEIRQHLEQHRQVGLAGLSQDEPNFDKPTEQMIQTAKMQFGIDLQDPQGKTNKLMPTTTMFLMDCCCVFLLLCLCVFAKLDCIPALFLLLFSGTLFKSIAIRKKGRCFETTR